MSDDVSPCRSCRRVVHWRKSAASGTPMPLDRDDTRGNVLVDVAGRAHVFRDHETADAAAEEDPDRFGIVTAFFISHHAAGQCSHGPAWRGKRRGAPDAPQAELF